jgi:hypothetical protein
MTIATLLGHFGIHVPRYVTMDGQIVFDGVTPVAGGVGFTHPSHGSVTPVARHTFHGGEDLPEDGPDGSEEWWNDETAIARHVEAMKEHFPNFVYVPAEDDMAPFFIGDINTGRGHFKIGVVMRRDQALPTVRVVAGPKLGVSVSGRWKPSPHLYLSGNLCVADRDDWNPEEHTAATVTAWAAHWLAAFTEWRITRRWPVEGVQSSVA